MTTNVKVFKSTDTNAAAVILAGTAGYLINVLQACLVDGYGAANLATQNPITRDGTTATATKTTHGFVIGQCVLHAGATQTEYNGEHYVTGVPTADTYTFTVSGTPDTPATPTGTYITTKQAPAGWTKQWEGTNLAAYLTGGGNSMVLRVDDTPAQFPRLVGYESMSDINTGVGPFPTAAQVSGGLYAAKSDAASTAARPWTIVATDRLMYLFINTTAASAANNLFIFGDIKSYKSEDAYATLLAANTSGANSSSSGGLMSAIGAVTGGNYMARSYSQVGSSLNVGKHSDFAKGHASAMGYSGLAYPNGADGGLYMAPVWAHEIAGPNVRGELPGLWNPCHAVPLAHLDTLAGAGTLAGKTFLAWKVNTSTLSGMVLIETSNTWSI